MSFRFRVFFCELGLQLLAEMSLGVLQFDNLADYTEFLKQREAALYIHIV